jgi:hypothetical protein
MTTVNHIVMPVYNLLARYRRQDLKILRFPNVVRLNTCLIHALAIKGYVFPGIMYHRFQSSLLKNPESLLGPAFRMQKRAMAFKDMTAV